VANMLQTAGADSVLTMDLHCTQVQGFFDIPVDNLRGIYTFMDHFKKHLAQDGDFVAVSPDLGSVARVRYFAEGLQLPLAIVDKRRQKANEAEVMNVIGEVKDKNVMLLDDMIDTGGSLLGAATAIKNMGAKDVYACITHPLLSRDASERIGKSILKKMILLNTIAVPAEKQPANMKILSVANYFANAIRCIHTGDPINEIYAYDPIKG